MSSYTSAADISLTPSPQASQDSKSSMDFSPTKSRSIMSEMRHESQGMIRLIKRSPIPTLHAATIREMSNRFDEKFKQHETTNPAKAVKWANRGIAVDYKSYPGSERQVTYYRNKQEKNTDPTKKEGIDRKLDFWEQFFATTERKEGDGS